MTPRRGLGTAVVACLAGAGLALYGATRVWSVQLTERPGLTSLRSTTTGAAQSPWLVGLALVALAGAGALLATRGLPRRLLGVLLIAVGIGLVAAAFAGRATLDPGAAGPGATVWPIVCALAGFLPIWAGVTAARHGHRWPAMGSRYERSQVPSSAARLSATPPRAAAAGPPTTPSPIPPPPTPPPPTPAASTGEAASPAATAPVTSAVKGRDSSPAAPSTAGRQHPPAIASVDTRAAWDALDRGDDPTT